MKTYMITARAKSFGRQNTGKDLGTAIWTGEKAEGIEKMQSLFPSARISGSVARPAYAEAAKNNPEIIKL